MEEVNSKQKNAMLRALIKEFKERWTQYQSEGHQGDQVIKWETDGWQWEWEVNNRYSMVYLAVELPGEYDWDTVKFSICVFADEEPTIEIEVPMTDKALNRATKSLVKWIKKEMLAGVDDNDIDMHIIALG